MLVFMVTKYYFLPLTNQLQCNREEVFSVFCPGLYPYVSGTPYVYSPINDLYVLFWNCNSLLSKFPSFCTYGRHVWTDAHALGGDRG
jgi:hypothetical protein